MRYRYIDVASLVRRRVVHVNNLTTNPASFGARRAHPRLSAVRARHRRPESIIPRGATDAPTHHQVCMHASTLPGLCRPRDQTRHARGRAAVAGGAKPCRALDPASGAAWGGSWGRVGGYLGEVHGVFQAASPAVGLPGGTPRLAGAPTPTPTPSAGDGGATDQTALAPVVLHDEYVTLRPRDREQQQYHGRQRNAQPEGTVAPLLRSVPQRRQARPPTG